MARVFACFVAGHLLVMLAVACLGLFQVGDNPNRHVALAVFLLLLTCLLQVLVFVYLNVTGKMIAQAVHLRQLDLTPVEEARRLKFRFTRIMATVIGATVLITATGAYQWREGLSLYYHFPSAFIFLAVHVASSYLEYVLICENRALVEEVLRRYHSRSAGYIGSGPASSEVRRADVTPS